MPELDKVHFATISRYDFDLLQKDPKYFYFVLEDDGRYSLYVGDKLTSNAISIVESFPQTGEMARFYFQPSTGIMKIWSTEWVQVFPAQQGTAGKSAYEVWLDAGHEGTEEDFFNYLKGPKGDTGDTGPQGPQGVQGVQGPKGDTGATGATGSQGPTGATGATGLQGASGSDGETPTIDVTSVLTVPAGSPAEARITGTSPDLHLELKIPQGAQGTQGPQGPQGNTGEKGDNGKSAYQIWLEEGNEGTEEDFLDSLKGPKGDTGVADYTLVQQYNEAAQEAKEDAESAAKKAGEKLTEFNSRLSSSYIYGMDWTEANLLADEAGQCVVLNNIYDNEQYNATLRYMNVDVHGVLPAHNFKRCVCSSARNVAYYTHPSNSNLKVDGVTPSVLTGADGDFMVEMDITYGRIDTYVDSNNITHYVRLVSDQPFNGSQPNRYFYVSSDGKTLRKQYVGACRSTMCDADGNTLNNTFTATADTSYAADKEYFSRSSNVFTKLTAGTDYTVGGTLTQGSTVDTKIYTKTVAAQTGYLVGRKCRSVAGAIPAGSVTRANFRAAHANNGYDSVNFLFASYLGMMMAIEFGSFNAQSKFSVGYTNLSSFDTKALRLTGRTAIFGNNSGEIIADDVDASGEDYDILTMKSGGTSLWNTTAQGNHAQRVVQCSYRGIEDPFGSQWCNDDGIQKNQNAVVLSITYDGNVYDRDSADDPASINIYGWLNGTTKFYTTSAQPEVGLNLYANTGLSTVTGAIASVEGDYSSITVGTETYTRSSSDDTTGRAYAWKNGSTVIYSHVASVHTDANTKEVFSDTQLTTKLGSVSSSVDDYSESGYWCTQATTQYSKLDSDKGRLSGDEYVFPATGYTGETIVWVHHEWPKVSVYPSKFDPNTFFAIRGGGGYGSTTKVLCDQTYNDTAAGARLALRFGLASYGGASGPFCVIATYALPNAATTIGSRSAA